jgi:nucleotide-binding universal stress UspA family protein
VNPTPPIFLPMEPIPIDLDAEWQDAQAQLNRFAANTLLKDALYEAILGRGETWNVIDDIIRQHSIDLVILGTRGKHGLKKLLFGSGAEKIFRHADCPVLTIGPNVEAPTGNVAAFRHIVFATDFSAGSLQALPYALSLAEENQATLSFLHVMPMVIPQRQGEVAPAGINPFRCRRLVPSLRRRKLRVSVGRDSARCRRTVRRSHRNGRPQAGVARGLASSLGHRVRGDVSRALPGSYRSRLIAILFPTYSAQLFVSCALFLQGWAALSEL